MSSMGIYYFSKGNRSCGALDITTKIFFAVMRTKSSNKKYDHKDMPCDFRWQELGPRLAQCPFLPSMATITRWPTTQKSTSKGSQRKSEFIYISSFCPSVMLDLHYLRGSNLYYLDLVNCKCKPNSGI